MDNKIVLKVKYISTFCTTRQDNYYTLKLLLLQIKLCFIFVKQSHYNMSSVQIVGNKFYIYSVILLCFHIVSSILMYYGCVFKNGVLNKLFLFVRVGVHTLLQSFWATPVFNGQLFFCHVLVVQVQITRRFFYNYFNIYVFKVMLFCQTVLFKMY